MATNPPPVRHDMSYEACGEYDPKTKSYSIVRVPRPPKGRISNIIDQDNRSRTEIAEVKVACPHCLVDVAFRWVTAKATNNFVEDLKKHADEKISRFFERRAREAYQEHWVDNYAASLEDFNS